MKIAGYVPFALHHDRNGINIFVVDIAAADRPVGQVHKGMEGAQDGRIDAAYDIAGIPADEDGNITITLHSNSALAPTSADQRTLSFIISLILLE